MDGLKAIQERILSEAEEKAKEIKTRGKRNVEDIISEAEKQRNEILAAAEAKAREQAEAMIKRAESLSSMERRKAELNLRQEQIAHVIDLALRKLKEKPDNEKVSVYCNIIRANGIQKGEITLSKDEQSIGPALLKQLKGDFSLSKEPGDFKGGMIIRNGPIEDNLTFDLIVRNLRPDLTTLAASMIFDD